MADLIVLYHGQPLLREGLDSSLTIGNRRDNDVCLLEGVAPYHGRIEKLGGKTILTPKDGAIVFNGRCLAGSHSLQDGDIFDLGGYRCQFFENTRSLFNPIPEERTSTASTQADRSPSRKALSTIHFLAPEKTKFRRTRILVGRSPSSDLAIDNNLVSSRHAEVFFHDGRYYVRDLHSRNGTYLNDQKITERALPPAGVIRLGRVDVPYQIDSAPSSSENDIPGITIPGLRPGEGDRMLVGASRPFQTLLDRVGKIASADDAVLLLGETGVGKDVVAQYLHASHPKRKSEAFVAVNCASIPQTLAESQLFGHVRGAFSGAVGDHRGYFQEAHKGTLFLDEVGDLPLETQARLLRVIEDGYVRPVGASREIPLDVRLVFATNKALDDARDEGKFRDDLFQRFQWVVKIPPLRERSEDIPYLVRYFLKRHATTALSISPEIMDLLRRLPWRGNVRELNRAVRRAITNASVRGSDTISLEDFELNETGEAPMSANVRRESRSRLRETLKSLRGNISHAAKTLGVSRVTIHKWIKEDGIELERLRR